MNDKLKEHRVIGIRHALKAFKNEGLVDDDTVKPPNSWTLFCTNFMPPLPLGCGQPAPWPGWHNHAAGAANAR